MCKFAQNDGAAQTNPTPTPRGARGLLSRSAGAVLSSRANLKTLHMRAIKRLVAVRT